MPHDPHELDGRRGIEIADGGARKKDYDAGWDPPRPRQSKWLREVGAGGEHLQAGIGVGNPVGGRHEMRARDVDGNISGKIR